MTAADCLVAALARAQAAFPTIHKTKTNPHFKSQYADLGDVLAAVRPVLAAEGIAVVQPIRVTDQGAELVTALLWGSERIESAVPLQIDGKPQELGSRLTYLRRYQLAALCGVAADDDDDGNVASAAVRERPARRQRVEEQAPEPDVRREEAGIWAAALTGDRLDAWTTWKLAHPGWHRKQFDQAWIVLRDLFADEQATAGAEPFDVDEAPAEGVVSGRAARAARARADVAAQALGAQAAGEVAS